MSYSIYSRVNNFTLGVSEYAEFVRLLYNVLYTRGPIYTISLDKLRIKCDLTKILRKTSDELTQNVRST